MRMQIARNVLWLVLERGLQVVFGIASIGMIARAIGPEGFAEFQYAQSLVLVASSVALICGAEVVVPRLVADRAPAAQHRLLVHVFALREAAAIAGYLMMMAVVALTEDDEVIVLTAIIIGIPILFNEPFGTVRAWLQASTNSRPAVVFGMIGLAFRVAAIGGLYLAGSNAAPTFAWVFAGEALIGASLLACHYRKRSPRVAVSIDVSLATRLLRDGTVFWASLMLMLLAKRIDQLLLKPHISLFELGGYAASMQVLDNFMLLSSIVASSVAPLMIYAQPTFARVRRNVLYVAAGMLVAGIVGGAVLAFCAPWIVSLIYGDHYEAAAELLRLSAMASGLVFLDSALTLLVVYLGKPRWLVEKWFLVLSTMIVVDLIMIPMFGARGAVYGYVAGNAVAVMAGVGFFIRSRVPMATRQQPV